LPIETVLKTKFYIFLDARTYIYRTYGFGLNIVILRPKAEESERESL